MLICAAIKIKKDNEDIIIPCLRHGDGYHLIHIFNASTAGAVEGFIDNNGKFYNREEAFKYAREIGQLSKTISWYQDDNGIRELYSEDLY